MSDEIEYHHLSDQAISAIVMAVQQGILNQEDVTDMLRNFSLVESEEGLVVNNPPRMRVEGETYEEMMGEPAEEDADVIVDPEEDMNE